MSGSTIVLGLLATCLLTSALFVVHTRNLVHGVLWLGVTLAATAVLFLALGAPFVAGVQVLLYVGGVMTLMIFGVMLTRSPESGSIPPAPAARKTRAALACGVLFGAFAASVIATPLPAPVARAAPDTRDLGAMLLRDHALAFEVVSLLLLAAMIGAIVVARRRDHGAEERPAAWEAGRP